MIEVTVFNGGVWYNISPLVESIKWSGDYKQCCRKLEFSIAASSADNRIPKVKIESANTVCLYENDKIIFIGIVYNFSKSSSSNSINYLAFDYGVKLNDIKVAYNIKNKTADEVVDLFLKDYVLDKGDIYKTKTRTSKVFLGVTAYDMLMTMYTEASKVDGNKYMINYIGDKLNVVKKGDIRLKVSFEEGKNLITSSFSESMENMVNKVVIVDEYGNRKGVIEEAADKKRYGLFQDILRQEDGKDNNSIAKGMLKGIEKTCSLEGYGDTSCLTGYGVTVKDSFTGLVGLFYIDSDTHTWEGGEYKISLALNFKNIMNEVNAGEEEQEKTSTSSGGGVTVTGGKEVDCEFTAYYPANNSMEGGFMDALGNRLDPSKLTCAAPKSVAFGTKIQVKGTNTSKDNLVYKVNDRGGRINISGGLYHIDLLVTNKTEANKFGRRRGKAIIGVTETSSGGSGGASNSSKANKAAEYAKAQLGKRYVWGATGQNTFDCSGLTLCAYKSVGVQIPRVSGDQSRFGKAINKKDLQVGDLLFFDTMNKGRVSHVGIYIGNGNMVHAANPKKGVRQDNVMSGYYAKALLNIRRVV